MPSSASPVLYKLLIALTAAVSATFSQTAAARAGTPAPFLQIAPKSTGSTPAAVVDTVLKRLPAGVNELTFRGESASRSVTVQLGRSEAARTNTFQLALLNAVSLLPERSIIKLSINGTVLAAVQAGSTAKPILHAIRIPPGVLVPGANTVRISATLSHRVDCSVQATYELWAMLEPSQTGFVVPRDAASSVRSLDELALQPLAADGTTRIHVRIRDDPDATAVTQVAGAIAAVARRAALVRPVVDVGPDRGTGAGFDIVVSGAEGTDTTAEGLTAIGRSNGVVIGRDSVSNRLVVIVASNTDAAVPAAAPAAVLTQANRSPIRQGFRKTFAELGLPTEVFAGRHYTSAIDVALPPDFLASNDRARLLMDASHSASLIEGSGLVFRVNGTLVSSMPLASGKAERLQHAIVELPLRFFHPGHNELSIEGTTSATADAQCDTLAMPREPRLTIAGSSELDFPNFTHLATLPQIPAALAFDAGATEGSTHLYMPAADHASLGAGLTVLANMAITQERINAPQFHGGMPSENDPPGIVIGALGELPENLNAALGKLERTETVPADPASRPDSKEATAVTDAATSDRDSPTASNQTASLTLSDPTTITSESMEAHGAAMLAASQSLLRGRGFFFAGDQRNTTLPVTNGSLVIAAVAPQTASTTVVGITVPQVTRDASHWLVLTAADRNTIQSALGDLVGSGLWAALAGEAVSFDPKADTMQVLQPRTVSYVLPDRLVMSDLRPILGGVMSDNILLSVGFMLILMTVLGLSTHIVIRRMGVR